MAEARYVVELGMGVDLHGRDMTRAACRAVADATGRSCLCGLVEMAAISDPGQVLVDIVVAVPRPEEVDLEQVAAAAPVGRVTARAVPGGMLAPGLCVPAFGPDCDEITIANAAVTVRVADGT